MYFHDTSGMTYVFVIMVSSESYSTKFLVWRFHWNVYKRDLLLKTKVLQFFTNISYIIIGINRDWFIELRCSKFDNPRLIQLSGCSVFRVFLFIVLTIEISSFITVFMFAETRSIKDRHVIFLIRIGSENSKPIKAQPKMNCQQLFEV